MYRGVHILVICAILPGVILPGQIALCVCEAIACAECGTCCAAPAGDQPAHRDCCSRRECRGATRGGGLVVTPKKNCQGCVVLTPDKQAAPAPEATGKDHPHLVAIPPVALEAGLAALSVGCAAAPRPTSHSPPGRARSLPLVI